MSDDAAAISYGYRTQGVPVLQLPLDKTAAGPATRYRWRRTAAIYALVFAIGLLMAWTASAYWATFGLGLMFPGAGFLYHATGSSTQIALHVGLFIGSIILFLIGLFLWVATGNIVAPVITWLGPAWAAALMTRWHVLSDVAFSTYCRSGVLAVANQWHDARLYVPASLVLIALALLMQSRRKVAFMQSERTRINTYLKDCTTTATVVSESSGLPEVRAASETDLQLWRFMLDRALQPVDEFNGFDRIDEFREAAKRYQICNMSYMLGIHTYTHTPAFRGYVAQAQTNLSLKMMDHRCWSYWQMENVWGNFRSNPDPFARDNIMYYGWYGGMLGINLCNTGDEQFNRPGSIRLQHPNGSVYQSSFSEICQIIRKNMQGSDFCLFPCEPRWIYPICNNFGALSLKCHDRVYGTRYWEEIRERYQESLEREFVTINGRITAIRDYHTGMTVPALTATMADAVTALFIHPLLPELACRSWEIVRHDLIKVGQGKIELLTNGWDKIDFGNYRRSMLTTYALVAASAREMGDDEVADLILQRLDSEHPSEVIGGVRHYKGGSTSAHAVIHAARTLRANGFHDLVDVGMPKPWKEGPILESAEYPQVLVAKAVSDGVALDLQLSPGKGGGRHRLELSQLRPNQTYQARGAVEANIIADAQGRAAIHVQLDRTLNVLVSPRS